MARPLRPRLAPLLAAALAFLLIGCSSGPRFAESFDHVPESEVRSPSNVLTRTDIERYPMHFSLEELLGHAYPSMAHGVQIRNMGPPLFVIDGIPTQDAYSALGLRAQNIEQVEVLRDGATALYGFRGANGAVLVTLRRR